MRHPLGLTDFLDPYPDVSEHAGWVRYACDKIGADRILFGTDYGVGGGDRGDVAQAATQH